MSFAAFSVVSPPAFNWLPAISKSPLFSPWPFPVALFGFRFLRGQRDADTYTIIQVAFGLGELTGPSGLHT
nr:hypothetical protein [Pantoea sp.]